MLLSAKGHDQSLMRRIQQLFSGSATRRLFHQRCLDRTMQSIEMAF
jgi:hypothetical protein